MIAAYCSLFAYMHLGNILIYLLTNDELHELYYVYCYQFTAVSNLCLDYTAIQSWQC